MFFLACFYLTFLCTFNVIEVGAKAFLFPKTKILLTLQTHLHYTDTKQTKKTKLLGTYEVQIKISTHEVCIPLKVSF